MGALALRSNHAGAARDLVLACARDRREILSSSFFWRGRNSDHERELVLEDRKTDNNFELNSGAFRARNRRRTEAQGRIPETRLKVLIPPQIDLELLFFWAPTSTTGC